MPVEKSNIMPTSGVINGTNLRLYLSGNAVAYATNCTISMSRELRETLHKDNPGSGMREIEVGRGQFTVTVEALYNEDGTNNKPVDLVGFFNNKTRLTCKIDTTVSGDTRYEFFAFLTAMEINAPVEENSSYSATLEGDGALTVATNT